MLFLDTSAVLELLYGTEKGEQIKELVREKPIAIASLSIHELLVGLKENEKDLHHFLKEVDTIPFDRRSAEKSAEIARSLKEKGKMINQMDVLIAAICLVNQFTFVTCDKHFLNIEGLDVRVF